MVQTADSRKVRRGIKTTFQILIPVGRMLSQQHESTRHYCESAWRTANTGSNPVGRSAVGDQPSGGRRGRAESVFLTEWMTCTCGAKITRFALPFLGTSGGTRARASAHSPRQLVRLGHGIAAAGGPVDVGAWPNPGLPRLTSVGVRPGRRLSGRLPRVSDAGAGLALVHLRDPDGERFRHRAGVPLIAHGSRPLCWSYEASAGTWVSRAARIAGA